MVRKTLDKKQAGTTICSFAYELDKAGIRQSAANKDGKYERFGCDPRYQLKSDTKWSAKVPGTRDYQYLYDYDPNGNRLLMFADGVETAYVYGDNSELTDAGGAAWTYDHFGNALTMGNTNVAYDFQGHALTISETGKGTDTHEYDGDGRRMRSKLDDASDWTNFIHDELTENLISEYTLISGTFTIEALNTYGLGLISSNRQGTIRYFHFDGLGTTQYLTDSTQAVTDSYTYDAFGVPISATGSSTNPYRYVGQWGYYDDGAMGSTSEMLLLGVRYYWPKYGRFTVWDPMDNPQLYDYCLSSPQRLIDPFGGECGDPPLFYWPLNTGFICIDCSCAKKIGVWIIPEASPRAFGAKCDVWYRADGFVFGGVTYKIDGGSSHIIKCTQRPKGKLAVDVYSRQRNYATSAGKECQPYSVPPGEFGGGIKEPPKGVKPPYVRK